MSADIHPRPTVFVILGIGGDLARRKLIPALYALFLNNWLPEKFLILGLGHKPFGDEDFIEHLRQGVNQFSRGKETGGPQWKAFSSHLAFQAADFDDPLVYAHLSKRL